MTFNSQYDSKFDRNAWNTTDLVLSIMNRCASLWRLDIDDDAVAEELYWICCSLESWPSEEGFGSSDAYNEIWDTFDRFHIVPTQEQTRFAPGYNGNAPRRG